MSSTKKPVFNHSDFVIHPLEPEDQALERANRSINSMVRDQIQRNAARMAHYTIIFILEGESQGLDSFTILEDLKRFMLEFSKQDEETYKAAHLLMAKQELANLEKAKKFEEELKK